jgi:hypothetical protein
VAVIAAAPGPVPDSLRHHLLDLPLDESQDQMQRSMAARRRALSSPGTQRADGVEAMLRPWRLAFSMLAALPVIIPADDDVCVPPLVQKHRPTHEAVFSLIIASALLHQHQRLRTGGAIIATAADIERGVRLATSIAASRVADLSAQSRQILARLWTAGLHEFTMDDLAGLLPGWTRWGFRTAIDELTRLDCIDAGRGGRGRLRSYVLVAIPAAGRGHRIQDVAGLAGNGGEIPPTQTQGAQHA